MLGTESVVVTAPCRPPRVCPHRGARRAGHFVAAPDPAPQLVVSGAAIWQPARVASRRAKPAHDDCQRHQVHRPDFRGCQGAQAQGGAQGLHDHATGRAPGATLRRPPSPPWTPSLALGADAVQQIGQARLRYELSNMDLRTAIKGERVSTARSNEHMAQLTEQRNEIASERDELASQLARLRQEKEALEQQMSSFQGACLRITNARAPCAWALLVCDVRVLLPCAPYDGADVRSHSRRTASSRCPQCSESRQHSSRGQAWRHGFGFLTPGFLTPWPASDDALIARTARICTRGRRRCIARGGRIARGERVARDSPHDCGWEARAQEATT